MLAGSAHPLEEVMALLRLLTSPLQHVRPVAGESYPLRCAEDLVEPLWSLAIAESELADTLREISGTSGVACGVGEPSRDVSSW